MFFRTLQAGSTAKVLSRFLSFKTKMARKLDEAAAKDILENVDNFLFDCDGVLWIGSNTVISGSPETVAKLKSLGKKVFYVTNNSSKSRTDYVQKCIKNGYQATLDEIVCTSYTAALYLKNIDFKGKVYVVGNTCMGKELDSFGIKHTGIGPHHVEASNMDFGASTPESLNLDPEINCVLVGFDPYISYWKVLYAATYAKRKDCLFIATNEDSVLPMPGDIVIPGTGTMVSAVKVAAHRQPTIVGKPEKTMFEILAKANHLDPKRTVMVGDRCNTDMKLATNCGLRSLLVLSGVYTQAELDKDLQSSDPEVQKGIPEFYTDCLGDLGKFIS